MGHLTYARCYFDGFSNLFVCLDIYHDPSICVSVNDEGCYVGKCKTYMRLIISFYQSAAKESGFLYDFHIPHSASSLK